ncbi:MAG TPA: hypothetical protein VK203_01400 [Nostocaceae cyanobacterium]|nr:hypothetical protein [Nostocaceae cyanobacterium]
MISFRFNDAEIEALQEHQLYEDESPSQTASRLLREFLGISKRKVPTDVDKVDIRQLVRKEVEEILAKSSVAHVDNVDIQKLIKQEVEKQLGELAA